MKGTYLKNITNSVRLIEKALANGTQLSRREAFDFYFKRDLLILNKMHHKGMFDVFDRNLNEDRQLAHFYAVAFNRVIKVMKKGYSYKILEKLMKAAVSSAWYLGIIEYRYKLKIQDIDGIVNIRVVYGKQKIMNLKITGRESFVEAYVNLVSFLVCDLEDDVDYKFMWDYLHNELNNLRDRKKPEMYVEKEKVVKELRDFLAEEKARKAEKRDVNEEEGKIIQFASKIS